MPFSSTTYACTHVLMFSTASAPTRISTLSLHDALPISAGMRMPGWREAMWTHLNLALRSGRERPGNSLTDDELRSIEVPVVLDRKSTRLNSSHLVISYAVFCLKKKT